MPIPIHIFPCQLHRLHLCSGVRLPLNECPGYEIKQCDGEVPVMLELWGMRSIPLLLSLPGPLWPGVVAPDRVLSMSQIELNCVRSANLYLINHVKTDRFSNKTRLP